MILQDGMVLYHGSYVEIDNIDLSLCDENKDFGQGFYMTTSKYQAVSFIKTSLAKAKRNNTIPKEQTFGYVTSFRIRLNLDVIYHEFESINQDWLYYISLNRRRALAGQLEKLLSEDFNKYEVLVGKIANDDTNMTLNAFLAGAYGEVDSDQAFAIVTQLLRPERLENQFCFKSKVAINMLEKVGAEKYEI